MAVAIEAIDANGVVSRSTVEPGEQLTLPASAGTTYRIVDDNGRAIGSGPRVLRIGSDLRVDQLPDDQTIELSGFFTNCTPENSCALSLEELGGRSGETITPASEPVAALTEGGFLMNARGSSAVPQEPGSEFNWKPVAGGAAGLVVVGAVAGGGGGGGGGADTSAPGAPTLANNITNSATPLLQGKSEAGSTVSVAINVGSSGQIVGYATTADGNGDWSVDTASAIPVSGAMPAGGLPADVPSPISISARDAAGNVSEPLATALTLDLVPPSALATITTASDDIGSITGPIAAGGVTDDSTPLISGTLTTQLQPGEVVQILIDGQVVGDAVVSNLDWQFDPAPLGEGNYAFTARVVDAAGNASLISNTAAFSVDTTAPVTPTIAAVTEDDVVNLPEATAGVTVSGTGEAGSSIELSWGTTAARMLTVDAAGNWSSVYQSADLPPDGTRVISAVSSDTAGNTSEVTREVIVDQSEASLEISSSANGEAANSPVTITFTFEEPVSGFTADDIVINGATPGVFTTLAGGTTYTLELAPLAASEQDATITVAAGAAVDAQGNASTAANLTQTFDTAAPSLTITDNISAQTASGPIRFTFRFSEPVENFDVDDITVSSGTKGTFSGSGDTYTLLVTPTGASGTVGVAVAAGAATDAVGNPVGAASATQAFDLTAPALTITDNVSAPIATGPITYRFTFSEPVTGFSATDVSVANGSKGTFSGSGSVYTLVVVPTGTSGTVIVNVPQGAATDAAGNPSAAASAQQDFDSGAPTLTITDNVASGQATGPVTYTFSFDEVVSGFQNNDITVTGGSKGAFTTVTSGRVYRLVVNPTADAEGDITVTVRANAATDGAGNGTELTRAADQPFDTLEPGLTITASSANAASPVTYTFTFAEPVTNFTRSDITVTSTQGTPSTGNLTQVNSRVFRLVITPPDNEAGDLEVSVAANAFQDTAGNANSSAVVAPDRAFDTDDIPAVTITGPSNNVTSGPVTYTFTWSEPVDGFTFADITPIVNGSATSADFSTVTTGSVYTLDVTPDSNTDANMTVSVRNNAAVDANGNRSDAVTSDVQPVDTVRPRLNISGVAGDVDDEFVLTFTFTEQVVNFDVTDVSVVSSGSAAVIGDLLTSDNIVYTLDVTPAPNDSGDLTVTVLSNRAEDLADNGIVGDQYVQGYDTIAGGGGVAINNVFDLGLDQFDTGIA